jgi:hypothetical protein
VALENIDSNNSGRVAREQAVFSVFSALLMPEMPHAGEHHGEP